MKSIRFLGLLPGIFLLSGCLVPIPLEAEAPTDGGQRLEVLGGTPKFGSLPVVSSLDSFNLGVDVECDSPAVAGRLYLQLNGSCCDLDVTNTKVTRFLQNADTLPVSTNRGNGTTARYTIDFRQPALPCTFVSGSIAFIIPVLASGGFQDGPTGFRPEGIGITDRSHYWTVICP